MSVVLRRKLPLPPRPCTATVWPVTKPPTRRRPRASYWQSTNTAADHYRCPRFTKQAAGCSAPRTKVTHITQQVSWSETLLCDEFRVQVLRRYFWRSRGSFWICCSRHKLSTEVRVYSTHRHVDRCLPKPFEWSLMVVKYFSAVE